MYSVRLNSTQVGLSPFSARARARHLGPWQVQKANRRMPHAAVRDNAAEDYPAKPRR